MTRGIEAKCGSPDDGVPCSGRTAPDATIFAGEGCGIIYVQGEQKQTVTEDRMLDALLHECRELAARVLRGEARLIGAQVNVNPPEALPRKESSVPLDVMGP